MNYHGYEYPKRDWPIQYAMGGRRGGDDINSNQSTLYNDCITPGSSVSNDDVAECWGGDLTIMMDDFDDSEEDSEVSKLSSFNKGIRRGGWGRGEGARRRGVVCKSLPTLNLKAGCAIITDLLLLDRRS